MNGGIAWCKSFVFRGESVSLFETVTCTSHNASIHSCNFLYHNLTHLTFGSWWPRAATPQLGAMQRAIIKMSGLLMRVILSQQITQMICSSLQEKKWANDSEIAVRVESLIRLRHTFSTSLKCWQRRGKWQFRSSTRGISWEKKLRQ